MSVCLSIYLSWAMQNYFNLLMTRLALSSISQLGRSLRFCELEFDKKVISDGKRASAALFFFIELYI